MTKFLVYKTEAKVTLVKLFWYFCNNRSAFYVEVIFSNEEFIATCIDVSSSNRCNSKFLNYTSNLLLSWMSRISVVLPRS